MSIKRLEDGTFVAYIHIQKCAGMTMLHILRKVFHSEWRILKDRISSRLLPKKRLTLQESLQSKRHHDRYFQGHCCYGVDRLLPKPCTYFTVLRHPEERLVSLYNYSRVNTHAYYHQHAKDKTLEEFLLGTELMELDNGMCRFIAGDAEDFFINRTEYGNCDENLFKRAKTNIDLHFTYVGITERFNESLVLLSKLLNISPKKLYYRSRNITKTDSRSKAVPKNISQAIKEHNQYDYQLYAYALRRFENELTQITESDPNAVSEFESGLKKYQSPPFVMSMFKEF